jgi:hypothetical protein
MASCLHPALAKRAAADHSSGTLDLNEAPFESMTGPAMEGGVKAYGRGLDIRVLAQSDDIASAAVWSEPFLDLLHLARVGDRWLIVNALYERRVTPTDRAEDHVAVARLLDDCAICRFDDDVELARRIHHPALAERRIDPEGDGLALEETTFQEVLEIVESGLGKESFERTWEAQVLEVGHDIAAGRVRVAWWDVHLHLARFGARWMIVNILYRNRERGS